MNRDRLAAAHPAELRLAKISGDPDIIEGDNGKQLFAGLHSLPDLNSLVSNDSRGRGDDMGIAQVEFR
jgi:hypothetical protein